MNSSESNHLPTPRQTLSHIDQTLVSIFLNELPTQIRLLHQYLNAMHENLHNHSSIDNFIKVFQEIIQGGKIIRLDSIVEIGKRLEEYLKEIQNGKIDLNKSGEQCLHEILDFFNELAGISPPKMDFFIQEHWDFLRSCITQLRQLKQSEDKKKSPKDSKTEQQFENHSTKIHQDSFLDEKMYELFRIELDTQSKMLDSGLLELEKKPQDSLLLKIVMRAAHSIKGAARVIAFNPIVRLAHAMEDVFVAVQHHEIELLHKEVDQLLHCVDLLKNLSMVNFDEVNEWFQEKNPLIETLIQDLGYSKKEEASFEIIKNFTDSVGEKNPPASSTLPIQKENKNKSLKSYQTSSDQDRVLRITAQNLNHLMGMAGEFLVESRWLYPFEDNLKIYKNNFKKLEQSLDLLRDNLKGAVINEASQYGLIDLHDQLNGLYAQLTERLGELDHFIGRYASLSDRLYYEVINSRMRPFADGVEAFPRMVRDLAKQLGKEINFEIEGKSTAVDRDILEKLEAPLSHLLRNAVDHGIETPQEREAIGKSSEGKIKLEARHVSGVLAITVSDDGRGIDIEQIRQKIIEKNLINSELAKQLTDAEVVNFLFLPNLSTAEQVSEISGRGIGLNVVQSIVQEIGGRVRIEFKLGKGSTFYLQLPLTLSVIRALLVEISGQPYALPLARIDQSFLINRMNIEAIENRQFFHYEGQNIGLISAWEVLELNEPQLNLTHLPVIVLSDRLNRYGLVVDRLLGEKELVVQELDPRLGKIPDISAGAVLEQGSPVLIIDVEDIVRSIDKLLSGGQLTKVAYTKKSATASSRKRILVVDDSITVREVECRLLRNQGYEVETAVNGIDGWNAVRIGHYDLIISDVDMPRMDGIELLRAIKNDAKLKHLPVMIVSYKSSEEDRLQGLEVGADYYLTKSSFHDTTLIDAVEDLIGKSVSSR